MNKKIRFILLIILLILLIIGFTHNNKVIENQKVFKIDTIYNKKIKDTIIYNIKEQDSIIYLIKYEFNNEVKKIKNIDDSAAVELFKQLTSGD